MFGYYSTLAGFTTKQSLYWYFISSFPKATDVEKQILKLCERELKEKHSIGNIEWE
jgi:hypothetical protein